MCYHKKLLMMTFVFKTMGISLKKSERGLFSDAVKTILYYMHVKIWTLQRCVSRALQTVLMLDPDVHSWISCR